MAYTTLLTEAKFREIVGEWSKQIDVNWFLSSFQVTQDKHISIILGQPLLDQLLSQLNTNTVTADNQTLLTFIYPSFAWWVAHYGILKHNAHVVNVGVTTVSGGFHTAAPDQHTVNLSEIYRGDAVFYDNRLYEYLCHNREKYPLWHDHKAKAKEEINGSMGGIHYNRFNRRWAQNGTDCGNCG